MLGSAVLPRSLRGPTSKGREGRRKGRRMKEKGWTSPRFWTDFGLNVWFDN